MYNTCDYVNGVSTKDCFHHILEEALDLKEQNKYEESFPYFDILRKCLGLDFSIFYGCDVPNLFCFESSGKYDRDSMHQEIEDAFLDFSVMVQNGCFSSSYLDYLKVRERVLCCLIRYQESLCNLAWNEQRFLDEIKLKNLNVTLSLLQERILEVETHLAFISKR